MIKWLFDSGGLYLLISILFALSAIFKSVSADPLVVNIQWLCAIVFALAGLLRSKRKHDGKP
jgi:hypothetical protein